MNSIQQVSLQYSKLIYYSYTSSYLWFFLLIQQYMHQHSPQNLSKQQLTEISTPAALNMGNRMSEQQQCIYKWISMVVGIIVLGTTFAYLWNIGKLNFYYTQQQLFQRQLSHQINLYKDTQLSNLTIQQFLQKLKIRPINNKLANLPKSPKFKPTSEAYLAYNLYTNPDHPIYQQAQKLYYNNKYKIYNYIGKLEKSLCVISIGRNLMFQQRYKRYLHSLNRQEYQKYKVIVVDDFSDDGTIQAMRQFLDRADFRDLKKRITIVQNKKRSYALYSRDVAIMEYCEAGDIIVQVDPDDELIGRQVFRTINAIYSPDPQIWVMYSSYIYWSPIYGQPTQGISNKIPTKILKQGTYRSTTQWYTSATRTFYRSLYTKINKADFIDKITGTYYKWTSDLFIHYSLVQLAGLQHYKYIHQIFYYYNLDHNPYNATEKAISRLNSLLIKPYKKLSNLSTQAQKDERSYDTDWIIKQKQKLQLQLQLNNNK